MSVSGRRVYGAGLDGSTSRKVRLVVSEDGGRTWKAAGRGWCDRTEERGSRGAWALRSLCRIFRELRGFLATSLAEPAMSCREGLLL